jgi:hypothetical protein
MENFLNVNEILWLSWEQIENKMSVLISCSLMLNAFKAASEYLSPVTVDANLVTKNGQLELTIYWENCFGNLKTAIN